MQRNFFDIIGESSATLDLCTYMVHNQNMKYEWDPDKERTNRSKHGVRFADAVGVFEDDQAVTIEDPDHNETRFVTIGMAFSLSACGGFLLSPR